MSEDLSTMLRQFRTESYEQTARTLDELRGRLGRDALSMDEWNALVQASMDCRLEAYRIISLARENGGAK